jgi:hypothetical protein
MSPDERSGSRFLGCLIKGPAGCLAFCVGAVAVAVLLGPAAGGRVFDRVAERWFEQRFRGELELGDAWVGSLHGAQSIERVVLRDPWGEEVLRGSLQGPSFEGFLDGRRRYGPVHLRLELLKVVADEEGVTNLEHTFARRESAPDWTGRTGLSTDETLVVELEISILRLRFTAEAGRESLLEDLRFQGRLEWTPSEMRLVLEGGGGAPPPALRLRLDVARTLDGLERPWDLALALEGAPTALARALCPAVRPLAVELGARLDEFVWTRRGSAVALSCRDADASFSLHGLELDGLISGEDPLALALECGGARARAWLARFLPPLEGLDCDDPTQPHALRLFDFTWPLDGDWSRLAGEAELAFAPSRARLRALNPDGVPLTLLLGPQSQRLSVREGVLDYAGLQLVHEDGWLRFDGTLDLVRGERTLGVEGEAGGAPLERVVFEEGAADPSPVPVLPAPPAVPGQR